MSDSDTPKATPATAPAVVTPPASAPSVGAAKASNPHEQLITRGSGGIIRFGWIALLVGFVGFLAWAALAPLDSGVTAPGFIVVDSQRQKVQHLSGGIVEEILVRDGSHVSRDQVLMRLNRTRTQAELSIVRAQLLSSLAIEARLIAERDQHDTLSFPPEVEAARAADPRVDEVVRTQYQLFDTRRAAIRNELSILDESIRGLNEQLSGLRAQIVGKDRQLEILREELDSLQLLFEQGYVPRNRIFELERAVAETEARRNEDQANIGRVTASLGEVRLRKVQREQAFTQEVETQLTSTQREVDGLQQRRIALQDDLERVDIRAPVDGIVVGLRIHSVGGVVRPGEDIMEIVPDGEPLVVEVQIPIQSIELVSTGMPAMVRFSALSRLNPVVEGTVINVSADRLTDERSGMPYFQGRIEVSPEQLETLTYERIVPGMPAEVVIKTGEHSVLHYLLKPILDHIFSAFRER